MAAKLEQHPEIFMHPSRDRGYFLDDQARKLNVPADRQWEDTHSLEEYSDFFTNAGASEDKVCGEKSADYLYHTNCHERLATLLPNTKFIVTLRNPITRAWSQYWNEVGKGREMMFFKDAIAAWDNRKTHPYSNNHLSYIDRGFLDQSLAHFIKAVGSNRVHVVILERLIRHPDEEMKKVLKFLDVQDLDFTFQEDQAKRNTNSLPVPRDWVMTSRFISVIARKYSAVCDLFILKIFKNSKTTRRTWQNFLKAPFYKRFQPVSMTDEVKSDLKTVFAPHIEELRRLLNDDLSEWDGDFPR